MKKNPLILFEKSKEELIDEILRLQKENEKLRKLLEEKRKTEEQKTFLKSLRLAQRIKHPKTPGQKAGHTGLTRSKPVQIDRVIEQTLSHCPDCHHRLSPSQEIIEHIQEDIVPAHVEVTCFKKHRYYCRHCAKMVTAPSAPEEIPHSYLGPNVLIQTVLLKYHHGLPFNKIQELFGGLAFLKVSERGLAQALQRISEWLEVEESQILAAIRASPHIHMDETGWKVNGTTHWLWAAVNEKLAYYRIERSRGSKVVRSILSNDYKGILLTDFYSAYNRLSCRAQKCLVHLMREMRRCYLRDQTEEFLKYHKVLRRIIRDAIRLKEMRSSFEFRIYVTRVSLLRRRLLSWACRDYENKNLRRLANRFIKHGLELLTFLEYPEIPFHNNLAERMIRPHVILRNRSFQNRSEKGARAHSVLMSLLHTLRLQGKDVITSFKKAYVTHRQGNLLPVLSI